MKTTIANYQSGKPVISAATVRLWALLTASSLISPQTFANYAVFERHTDTIQVAGQTELDQTATYEAVFLLRGSHPHGGNIFNEFTYGQEDKTLMVSRNRIVGDSFEGTVPYAALMSLEAKVTVSTDIWHHVAMVTDPQEDRLYLDGKLVAAQPRHAPIQNGSGSAQVGAVYRTGTGTPGIRGFVGVLDSVRVSNSARYSGLSFAPPIGDLTNDANTILLYNFNDPTTNSTVADESALRRTGTLGSGFAGATSPKLVDRLDHLPPTTAQDIMLDPRATYLRTQNDRAYNSIPIPLALLGIQPGDTIFLEKVGDCSNTGDYETSPDAVATKVAGVFSSSAELGSATDLNRVKGAIKAGQDYATPVTATGGLATDISEDFLIPDTGVVLSVPQNAEYLFAAAVDNKYQDNFDWDANFGIHISKISLNLQLAAGKLVLNWDAGVLQSKTSMTSSWTDVPGAVSPLFVTPDKPAEFFWLRTQ